MTIQQLEHGSHVLDFTDISSALGWMHKAYFYPVNERGHDTVARWLGWTLISNEAYLYFHHAKGTENIIADSLARDFNISDQSLTKISTPFYHLSQQHHSTSNCHIERLSPGYFHYQHPRHDQGNQQIYCNQEVWQLGKVVHISQTNRNH